MINILLIITWHNSNMSYKNIADELNILISHNELHIYFQKLPFVIM